MVHRGRLFYLTATIFSRDPFDQVVKESGSNPDVVGSNPTTSRFFAPRGILCVDKIGPPAIQGWKIAREKLYAKNYARKVSCGNSKIALYILPARRQPSPRGIAARRPGCRPRPAAHPLLLTPCCSLPAAYTYAKRVLIPQDNNLLGKNYRKRNDEHKSSVLLQLFPVQKWTRER